MDDSSGGASGNSTSQWVILALSLVVTTVVGYVNFMNPAQRWQQLSPEEKQRLADERSLDARQVQRASEGAQALLQDWFEAGWLHRV